MPTGIPHGFDIEAQPAVEGGRSPFQGIINFVLRDASREVRATHKTHFEVEARDHVEALSKLRAHADRMIATGDAMTLLR